MALNRWSLDQLVMWLGVVALLALFVPSGALLVHKAGASAERSLLERGQALGRTLSGQLIEPMLVRDRLALHSACSKALASEVDFRYLCVVDSQGRLVADTFGNGHPQELLDLWGASGEEPTKFRTDHEALMNIPVPIMEGQLGTLHVGMSRERALRTARYLMLPMGFGLAGGLAVILIGARLVAAVVSRPLRELERQVSLLPQHEARADPARITGTREVESLARGFADMADRLDALESDRTSTHEKMVHAERLATLGQLAAGLAHEIFNPLDGMLECMRYLKKDPQKSRRGEKYYPMLEDGLERIAHVMKEMLTFARSGRNVKAEPQPVSEMMEAIELLVQTQLRGSDVRVTWDRDASCVCMCDQHGLAQIGLNLVLNAVRACASSADPEIRVTPKCDSRWVYISVEDSGPGVPKDHRERIFEPFFTTEPRSKGTGLGLSVSRDIARAVGGDLTLAAEPSPLGGARFIIKLPKAPAEENQVG